MLIFVQNSWPGPKVQQKPQNLQASSNGRVLFNCPLVQELSSWVSERNYYANEPLQLATYQVRSLIYSLFLNFFKCKMFCELKRNHLNQFPYAWSDWSIDWLPTWLLGHSFGRLIDWLADWLIDWLFCFVSLQFFQGLSSFYAASSQPLPVFIHRSHVAGE